MVHDENAGKTYNELAGQYAVHLDRLRKLLKEEFGSKPLESLTQLRAAISENEILPIAGIRLGYRIGDRAPFLDKDHFQDKALSSTSKLARVRADSIDIFMYLSQVIRAEPTEENESIYAMTSIDGLTTLCHSMPDAIGDNAFEFRPSTTRERLFVGGLEMQNHLLYHAGPSIAAIDSHVKDLFKVLPGHVLALAIESYDGLRYKLTSSAPSEKFLHNL